MLVVVIGAGAAGLVSAKYAISKSFECIVLEGNNEIGGTWILKTKSGLDEFGYNVHSAMYKGLRTNLPKEIMDFPDFPFKPDEVSFVTQPVVLNYLKNYAKTYDLEKHIKFNSYVTKLEEDGPKWKTTYTHKLNKTEHTILSDAVMICNGHHFEPEYPKIDGISKFKGLKCHSYDFKTEQDERFINKVILVVGGGPSGIDVVTILNKVGKVFLSKRETNFKIKYPTFIEIKPEIDCVLGESEIKFKDGTVMEFDVIIFCTGYKYSYPFLSESIGISVTDNHVEPLYKHSIHIEKPTLCFIGIPFFDITFRMYDLQVQFFLAFLSGKKKFPSIEEMYKDTAEDLALRAKVGLPKRKAHMLARFQRAYYNSLADGADVPRMPEVFTNIFDKNLENIVKDLGTFRDYNFKIIDDHNFIVSPMNTNY